MRRNLNWSVLGLVVALTLPSSGALAWGAGGHMMVAYIAQSRLTAKAKAQVMRLLKISIDPTDITARDPDFVNAAHWPDDIKSDSEFSIDEYNDRHFIDYPYSLDHTKLPTNLPKPNNIVEALKTYVGVLQDSTSLDVDKAQALRFIIHFVGDIHQPLHCATRVTSALPKGDRGGNDFNISVNDPKRPGHKHTEKLHHYWDEGLDTFPSEGGAPNYTPPPLSAIESAVTPILNRYPDSEENWKQGGPFDYAGWSQESFAAARTVAYSNLKPNGTPSTAYVNVGLPLAQQRIAWAGYRLATLLNTIWQ